MGSPSSGDSSQKAIEGDLVETGKKLLGISSSTDELLVLLERAESLLGRIWQQPPVSTSVSLVPLMKALRSDDILHHNDVNVQVAVASCFNQLTRITCTNPPYEDPVMMDVFRMFMIAFRQLTCGTGPNYSRAVLIVETMAKVRSFLVLLDIDNDGLIVEMFRAFLSNVKSSHPSGVFKYMEMIMTSVIEESDEISPELLVPLLNSVKMENKITAPISWELGKKVFENCSTKLTSCLGEVVKKMNLVLGDYAVIVTSICLLISHDASNGKSTVSNKATPIVGESDELPNDPQTNDDNRTKSNGKNSLEMPVGCQSGTDTGSLQKSRGKKPNSVARPEEGYQNVWTLKSKYSEISSGSFSGEKGGSHVASEKGNVSNLIDLSKKKMNSPKVKDIYYDHAPMKKGEGTVGGSSDIRLKKGKWILGDADKGGEFNSSTHGKQERTKAVSQKHVHKGDVNEIEESPMPNPAKAKEKKFRRSKGSCGEELINLRIQVWWPMDEMFYPGNVKAFNPETKKHTILYDDGETEVLNLKKEKWEMWGGQKLPQVLTKSSQRGEGDRPSPAQQSVKTLKKAPKRKTVSPKHVASSPKRSKRENQSGGTCVEITRLDFSLSNDNGLGNEVCGINVKPKDGGASHEELEKM